MNCPNCKAADKMSVCRSGVAGASPVFVECACGWSQAPLDALVIDAAVYTWHRANPTPAKPIDHDYEDNGFDEGLCGAVVDEADEGVTRCERPESAHQEAA